MIRRLIEKLLDKLLKLQSFQDYVNFRYNRKGYFPVSIKGLYYKYDTLFTINEQLVSIDEVINDYEFSDIKETDIVLDIGANIGAFTIFASKKAKHVFAVEPLYVDVLKKNLLINKIKNVTVLETGLGHGLQHVKYRNRDKTIRSTPLNEILKITGKIDFLKIDCEGGEWSIQPYELQNIQRIEAKIHNFDGKHNFNDFLVMLNSLDFEYKARKVSDTNMLIHATCKINGKSTRPYAER